MKKLFTLFVLMAGCFAFAACSDDSGNDSGNDSNPGTDQPGDNPGDSVLIEEKPEWINKPGAVSFMAEDEYRVYVYTFNIGDTLIVVDNEGNEREVISEETIRWHNDSTFICGFADIRMGIRSNYEKNEWTIKGNIKEMEVPCYVPYANYIGNKISGIDISTCPYLERFDCSGTHGDPFNSSFSPTSLTALIIGQHEALTYLDCGLQYLTSLDISGCSNLDTLYCYSNQLTSLDVSGCSNLINLGCGDNRLTLLDVSNCPDLEIVSCGNNLLTELDVTKNVKLITLTCGNDDHFLYDSFNKLNSLDVSQNIELTTLNVNNVELSSLNLSKNTKLTTLNVSYNELSSLDLSKNTKLTNVECRLNNFTDETMNDFYNLLPEAGFDKYGEPMGELLCDEELGDKSIAEEKGWYVHD